MIRIYSYVFSLCIFGFAISVRAAQLSFGKDYSVKLYERIGSGQRTESFRRLLANMDRTDAGAGAVIAATSRSNPDYFYHWTRDAALSVRVLVEALKTNAYSDLVTSQDLKTRIIKWIDFEEIAQENATRSQHGIGEPKYNVDGSVYGPWMSPQNDGPALRATTMIEFLKILSSEHESSKNIAVIAKIKTIVSRDLQFVRTICERS